jgi:hypothetical protein
MNQALAAAAPIVRDYVDDITFVGSEPSSKEMRTNY